LDPTPARSRGANPDASATRDSATNAQEAGTVPEKERKELQEIAPIPLLEVTKKVA